MFEWAIPLIVGQQRVVGRPDDLPTAFGGPGPDLQQIALGEDVLDARGVGTGDLFRLFLVAHADGEGGAVGVIETGVLVQAQRVGRHPGDRFAGVDVVVAELVLEDDGDLEVADERDAHHELELLAVWQPVARLPEALLDRGGYREDPVGPFLTARVVVVGPERPADEADLHGADVTGCRVHPERADDQ